MIYTVDDKQAQERECPRCQKPLMVRTSKTGELRGSKFLSCSNFPTCGHIETYKLSNPETLSKTATDINQLPKVGGGY